MKLLNLTQAQRDYFIAGKALYVDNDDHEALLGLTAAESALYVDVIHNRNGDPTNVDTAYLLNFLAIYERHQAAVPPGSASVEALKKLVAATQT
jgi:hypothetical protein